MALSPLKKEEKENLHKETKVMERINQRYNIWKYYKFERETLIHRARVVGRGGLKKHTSVSVQSPILVLAIEMEPYVAIDARN